MDAIVRLYGADPLAEYHAEESISEFTAQLLEIEEFFLHEFYNENHDEHGRFAPSDERSGNVVPGNAKESVHEISANAHAVLEDVHSHLQGALDIVKAHTVEGALIGRIQNGIREVQKGTAARKAAEAINVKEEAERIMKLPRWRDSNPSKSLVGRVGELLTKAASTLQEKFKREPEFRKEIYKEVAMAVSGVGIHFLAAGAAAETLGGVHAAIETTLQSLKKIQEL